MNGVDNETTFGQELVAYFLILPLKACDYTRFNIYDPRPLNEGQGPS